MIIVIVMNFHRAFSILHIQIGHAYLQEIDQNEMRADHNTLNYMSYS